MDDPGIEPGEARHLDCLTRGLKWYDARKYERALALFDQSEAALPGCPTVMYNRANVKYQLGEEEEAYELLEILIYTPDWELEQVCPSSESVRSLKLDAHFLAFLALLDGTDSWERAVPYLKKHLRGRCRGVRSLWSKEQILAEGEELRLKHHPRGKSVRSWKL